MCDGRIEVQRLLHIVTIVLLLAASALAADEANRQPAEPNQPPGNIAGLSLSGQVVTGDGIPVPGAILQTEHQAPQRTSWETSGCL